MAAIKPGKRFLDLGVTRRVLHFDSLPLAPDQARFPQCLEVLREGGFGNRLLVVFLASNASRWLSGEKLIASGGLR